MAFVWIPKKETLCEQSISNQLVSRFPVFEKQHTEVAGRGGAGEGWGISEKIGVWIWILDFLFVIIHKTPPVWTEILRRIAYLFKTTFCQHSNVFLATGMVSLQTQSSRTNSAGPVFHTDCVAPCYFWFSIFLLSSPILFYSWSQFSLRLPAKCPHLCPHIFGCCGFQESASCMILRTHCPNQRNFSSRSSFTLIHKFWSGARTKININFFASVSTGLSGIQLSPHFRSGVRDFRRVAWHFQTKTNFRVLFRFRVPNSVLFR